MPGYEMMFRKDKGILSWTWAVDRFSKAHNYYLSTTRSDGRPHVMPVWGSGSIARSTSARVGAHGNLGIYQATPTVQFVLKTRRRPLSWKAPLERLGKNHC